MKVITNAKVYVQGESQGYSGLDGDISSWSKADVKKFQIFANTKLPVGKKLLADGVAGAKTKQAFATYGNDYLASQGIQLPAATVTASAIAPKVDNLSPKDPKGNTKAGFSWDKVNNVWVKTKEGAGIVSDILNTVKGLFGKGESADQAPPISYAPDAPLEPEKNDNKKIIIIGGLVVITGIIVYLATRKTSTSKR